MCFEPHSHESEVEMVLVPRRPTREMVDEAWADALAEDAAAVWKTMIEVWLAQISKGN